MTNSTRRAIWSNGIIAMRMAFRTTWRPVMISDIKMKTPCPHLDKNCDWYLRLITWAFKRLGTFTMYTVVEYLLGTPDTRRRGRNTRNALNAFTSKPFILTRSKIVLTTLEFKEYKMLLVIFPIANSWHSSARKFPYCILTLSWQ